jgi:glycosyltransferase involved in cell wall biosynthesis
MAAFLGVYMAKSSTVVPLVAIVTPVLNGETFLKAAMDSVQAQTYPNIVHIILDNASTDGTAALLDAYDGKNVQIQRYRNDTILPITDNWDRAFAFVPNDALYVKLHCADDVMHATCIAKFVALCEENPSVHVVSCHDVYCDKIRRANIAPGTNIIDGKLAAKMIMDRSICWLPFQHLFGRFDSRDIGKPFFGTHKVGADPFAMVRMVLRGSLGYIEEPLVYTRRHGQNFSDRLATDGRTPVAALQINMMLMTYFEIMLEFGAYCLSEKAFARAKAFSLANIARTAIKWRFKGYRLALDDLEKTLYDTGVKLRYRNYLAGIFGFPAYIIWVRRKNTKIGPSVDPEYFSVTSTRKRPLEAEIIDRGYRATVAARPLLN